MALPTITGGGGAVTNLGILVTWNSAPAQAGMRTFSVQLNAMNVNIKNLQQSFLRLTEIVEALGVYKLVTLAQSFVNTMAEMQRLETQVATLTGSFAKAEDQIDSLIILSQSAPFSKLAITDAFVKLKASGIDPIIDDQGNGPLKNMLQAIAALGGTDDTVRRVAYAFQEMAGKGVVQTKELVRQIGIAVPTAIRDLSTAMGMSRAQFLREVQKGNVDAITAINTLLATWGTEYKGALDLFANTFIGATLQVKGAYQQLAYDLEKAGALDPLTAAMKVATQYLRDFANAIKGGVNEEVGNLVDQFFKLAENAIRAAAPLVSVAEGVYQVGAAILKMVAGVDGMLGSQIAVGGIIGYLLFGKLGAGVGILAAIMGDTFNKTLDQLITFVQKAAGALGLMGMDVTTIAEGGFIGFLLFGRKGLFIGIFTALFSELLNALTNALFQVNRLVQSSGSYIVGGIKGLFSGEGFAAGGKAAWDRNNAMLEAERKSFGFGKDKDGNITFFSDDDVSKNTTNTNKMIDLLDQFRIKFNVTMENIQEGRQKWGGLNQLAEIGGPNQEQMKFMEHFDTLANEVNSRLAGAQAGGNSVLSFVVGKQGEIQEANKQLADMEKHVAQLRAFGKSDQADALQDVVNNFRQEVNSVRGAMGALLNIENNKVFTQISQGIDAINSKTDARDQVATLGSVAAAGAVVADKYTQMKKELANYTEEVKKIIGNSAMQKAALDKIADASKRLTQAEKDQTAAAKDAAQDALIKKQAEIADQFAILKDRADQLSGVSGYDAVGTAVAKVNQEYDKFNKSIQAQLDILEKLKNTDPDQINFANEQIKNLLNLRAATDATQSDAVQRAIYETSLIGKMWKDVGEAIDTALSDAFTVLITGTGSLKDVMMSLWKSITNAVINYITQLLIAKVAQDALGGGAGNTTGSWLNAFFGSGNGVIGSMLFGSTATAVGGTAVAGMGRFLGVFGQGAAMRGNVKPFAAGDIIGGPTMFGIAGESGNEAIMPLTRGSDGKLGVNVTGTGADHYHLHFHDMIDGQTVESFFSKNADQVVNALFSRQRLNRGLRAN